MVQVAAHPASAGPVPGIRPRPKAPRDKTYPSIRLHRALRDRGLREALQHPLPPSNSEMGAKRGIVIEALEGFPKCLYIIFRDDQAAIADHPWNLARVGTDHRYPTSHCFHEHAPELLFPAWGRETRTDQYVEGPVHFGHGRGCYLTGKGHPLLHPQSSDVLDVVIPSRAAAHDHQPPIRRQSGQGVQEHPQTLGGNQSSDKAHRERATITAISSRTWPEELRVGAELGNHLHHTAKPLAAHDVRRVRIAGQAERGMPEHLVLHPTERRGVAPGN